MGRNVKHIKPAANNVDGEYKDSSAVAQCGRRGWIQLWLNRHSPCAQDAVSVLGDEPWQVTFCGMSRILNTMQENFGIIYFYSFLIGGGR